MTSQSKRKLVLDIHWKNWCWSWKSNTLATWCEELTHWKRPWCWERLKAGWEEVNREWDGQMHHRHREHVFDQSPWAGDGQESLACCSPWVCRVGHDWVTELNWTDLPWSKGTGYHDLSFFECWVLIQLFLSPLHIIKKLFSSPLLSAIRVVSSAYLSLLIFLLAILILAWE